MPSLRVVLCLTACLSAATPAWTAAPPSAPAQTAARPSGQATRLVITLPDADTELTVDGRVVAGTGETREVDLPPAESGKPARVTVSAQWMPNTYTSMTRTRTVEYRPGQRLTLDLTADDPADRVRVMYVPTPADISDEMVKLAGVTPSDIVYEPGCGDARITIAAVKAGARLGVGIDIDPERVTDSREKVAEAGLSDRIEIRLGDALDIKDLSRATVVFLYMGDHFNMLIRPSLWRQLPVGARVVSHRFTMGDWKPDRTVSIDSVEGGTWELHLWTITEEIKRKLEDHEAPR